MTNFKQISIAGLEVRFPFEPYPTQRQIMETIIKQLAKQDKTIVIESPTGTGKTLSILSAVTAWLLEGKKPNSSFIDEETRRQISSERADFSISNCYCNFNFDDIYQVQDTYKCRLCQDIERPEAANLELDVLPQIYYCTRTHQQLAQTIEEFKRISYSGGIKTTNLMSKARTCINEEAKSAKIGINDECRRLAYNRHSPGTAQVDNEICEYLADQNKLSLIFEEVNDFDVPDIEDFVRHGRENHLCPHYGMKSLRHDVELIFCPYNYILDPTIRQSMDINIKNAILIFDEGHNVESICRDTSTITLSNNELTQLISDIRRVMVDIEIAAKKEAFGALLQVVNNIVNFMQTLRCTPGSMSHRSTDIITTVPKDEMQVLLNSLGINKETLIRTRPVLAQSGIRQSTSDQTEPKVDLRPGKTNQHRKQDPNQQLNTHQFQSISKLLAILNMMTWNNFADINCFRIRMEQKISNYSTSIEAGGSNVRVESAKLLLLCVDAKVSFRQVQNQAWSTIIASGTLSPLSSLQHELGVDISDAFQGKHIIDPSRLLARMITRGLDRTIPLNCGYMNSTNVAFMVEIGRMIVDICKKTPDGLLCFFPSYDRLKKFFDCWQAKKLISQMEESGKSVLKEEKNRPIMDTLMKHNRISASSGSILFAVMKGKFSEGVDFPDSSTRAVITVGIPFQYPELPEIQLKKKYDEEESGRQQASGVCWYHTQSMRPVCQAIGRCIRSRNDWGAIIMIDQKFNDNNWKSLLPAWLQDFVRIEDNFNRFARELDSFMKKHKEPNMTQ